MTLDERIDLFKSDLHKGLNRPKLIHLKNNKTIIDLIFESINKISTIDFKDGLLELTPETLHFTLEFSGERILMLTKPFENIIESEDNDIIVYTLFENDDVLSANWNNIDDFVKGFIEYLDN